MFITYTDTTVDGLLIHCPQWDVPGILNILFANKYFFLFANKYKIYILEICLWSIQGMIAKTFR